MLIERAHGAGAPRRAGDHCALPPRGRVRASHPQTIRACRTPSAARTHRFSAATRRIRTGSSRARGIAIRVAQPTARQQRRRNWSGSPGIPCSRRFGGTPCAGAHVLGKGATFPLAPARASGAQSTSTGLASWMDSGRSSTAALRRGNLRGRRASAPGAQPSRQLHAGGPAGRTAAVAVVPEATAWLHAQAFGRSFEETCRDASLRSSASRRT